MCFFVLAELVPEKPRKFLPYFTFKAELVGCLLASNKNLILTNKQKEEFSWKVIQFSKSAGNRRNSLKIERKLGNWRTGTRVKFKIRSSQVRMQGWQCCHHTLLTAVADFHHKGKCEFYAVTL